MPIAAPKSNLYGADCAFVLKGITTAIRANKQVNMTERLWFISFFILSV
jgi:hypothetical protein